MSANISSIDPPRSLLSRYCERFSLNEADVRQRLDAQRPRSLGDDDIRLARREAIDSDTSDRRFRERILRLVETAIAPLRREVQNLRRDYEHFKAQVPQAIAAAIDADKAGAA